MRKGIDSHDCFWKISQEVLSQRAALPAETENSQIRSRSDDKYTMVFRKSYALIMHRITGFLDFSHRPVF
jgi:hypothetical protein